MTDYTQHSLWLSSVPVTISSESKYEYSVPSDDSFFYLGSGGMDFSNTYNGTATGIYGKEFSDALYVDGASGAVTNIDVSTTRVQPTAPTSQNSELSNASVIDILRTMKQTRQLLQGAYILRMYNITQDPSTRGIPYDIPVFLSSYTSKYDMSSPNTMELSLKFIKRSPVASIGLGTTVYS